VRNIAKTFVFNDTTIQFGTYKFGIENNNSSIATNNPDDE
jgi:hypothetical protein